MKRIAQLFFYYVVLSAWFALPWISDMGAMHSPIFSHRVLGYVIWLTFGLGALYLLVLEPLLVGRSQSDAGDLSTEAKTKC